MMILRTSAPSPYGRKIKIAASLFELSTRTSRSRPPTPTIPPIRAHPEPGRKNSDPGARRMASRLFDSRVIMEYLDHLAGGGRIIPAEPGARFAALRLQALGDGILDASLLLVYETRFRPEDRRERKWTDYQNEKGQARLRRARKRSAGDRRHAECRPDRARLRARLSGSALPGLWRKSYPKLVAWLDDFARRVPSFGKTKVEA